MAITFGVELSAESGLNVTSIGVSTGGTAHTAASALWAVARVNVDETAGFTDTQGNSYSAQGSVREAAIVSRLAHAVASPIVGGANTVTAAWTTAANAAVYVLEAIGAKSSPVDGHHENTDTGNNPTATLSVSNASQPGVMLAFGCDLQGGALTAGTGMTSQASVWATTQRGTAQYKAVTAVGPTTCNFVNAGFNRSITAAVILLEFVPTAVPSSGMDNKHAVRAKRRRAPRYRFDSRGWFGPQFYLSGWFWRGWAPPPAAAGAYSMPAELGTYALTGTAAGVKAARIMAAAQGSYAITGTATGVKRGYPLVAAQGAYALSGQSTALRSARKMTAAQASYALSGQGTGLKRGYPLVAVAGAYALTGSATGLQVGRKAAAAQGSYGLTGYAQGFVRGRPMAAAQGSYALTGRDVNFNYSGATRTVAADPGSYALSGQAARPAATRKLTAASGTFTLSGQAQTLRRGLRTTGVQGAYAITGQATAVRIERRLAAAQGAYSLSGQQQAMARTRVLLADAGIYAFTGQNTGLTYTEIGVRMSAETGFYVLTGVDAVLSRVVAVDGPSGYGFAPRPSRDSRRTPTNTARPRVAATRRR